MTDYKQQLKEVNTDLETLNNNLIKALQTLGLEFVDLNAYITRYDALIMRKNKLLTLIALE